MSDKYEVIDAAHGQRSVIFRGEIPYPLMPGDVMERIKSGACLIVRSREVSETAPSTTAAKGSAPAKSAGPSSDIEEPVFGVDESDGEHEDTHATRRGRRKH